MRRLILGTAGHIDHGKTELIKALTGIDTDRLQEEKARGISIDLGFAHLALPSGATLGIVDVPGHERFIRNMLAGVGGIDMVLFVVAGDEGIMPQTTEHFEIVSLLGVEHAVFALTKSDLVEDEMIELVREDVEGLIRGTRFEHSPIIPTSSKTGQGLDDVLKALEGVAAGIEERTIGEAVRLPVDRVFTMTGRGTVVTGTLWSGTIAKEDRLEVLPGSLPVRIRSIEVHGQDVDRAFAGQRTALGLHGVEKQVLERGHCIVSPGDFRDTRVLDAEIQLLPAAPRPLKSRARIRFHLGSSEVMARAFLLGTESLAAGDSCFAQMRLETPIVAALGDRFVIRTYSPMRTVGGGIVLDPVATKHRRRDQGLVERLSLLKSGDRMRIIEAYIKAAPSGARLEGLRARINSGPGSLKNIVQGLMGQERVLETSAGLYIHRDTLKELEDRIESIMKTYQAKNHLTWGMPKEELRERLGSVEMAFLSWILGRMEKDGRVFTKKGSIRAGSGEVQLSPVEKQARSLVLALLDAKPFQPPSEREIEGKVGVSAEVFRKVLSLLIQDGEVIRLEPGLIMLATAVENAKAKIRDYLAEHGAGTASDLKTALGTSRKYAVPLLEHLDRLGITRRIGDKRTLSGSELRN